MRNVNNPVYDMIFGKNVSKIYLIEKNKSKLCNFALHSPNTII